MCTTYILIFYALVLTSADTVKLKTKLKLAVSTLLRWKKYQTHTNCQELWIVAENIPWKYNCLVLVEEDFCLFCPAELSAFHLIDHQVFCLPKYSRDKFEALFLLLDLNINRNIISDILEKSSVKMLAWPSQSPDIKLKAWKCVQSLINSQ